MEEHVIKCDNCLQTIRRAKPQHYGGPMTRDITVTRASSQHGDLVPAGTFHFCNDECLVQWLQAAKEAK